MQKVIPKGKKSVFNFFTIICHGSFKDFTCINKPTNFALLLTSKVHHCIFTSFIKLAFFQPFTLWLLTNFALHGKKLIWTVWFNEDKFFMEISIYIVAVTMS